jgi:uncharacterized protein
VENFLPFSAGAYSGGEIAPRFSAAAASNYNFLAIRCRTFLFCRQLKWGYDREMKTVNLFVAALILSLLPTMFQPASAANSSSAQAETNIKSWLIRLTPPRPTFANDATPAEQALMEQHFAYWKDLNAKGVCTFGGPVLDPKGTYGILVVYAATQADAVALGDADPSVKAGLNKIDVAEMRVAFVPMQHT